MSSILGTLAGFWDDFLAVLNTVSIVDIIDVLVVAYIIYHAVRLIRETRAMQLVKGIAAILFLYLVASWFNLVTLGLFIKNVLGVGITAVVVLFQPEIRRALEQMGRTQMISRFASGQSTSEPEQKLLGDMIDNVCKSCAYLSERKIGALIVIERETRLGEIIKTGTVIDSRPSVELIANIFFTNSPLHDGAMVIRDSRLHAAGCYLPLSQNMEIGRDLGTRHRAALGMSEVSDAVIIVVSEETGAITVAVDSRLQRKLSAQNLHKLLRAKLTKHKEEQESTKKRGFWKVKK